MITVDTNLCSDKSCMCGTLVVQCSEVVTRRCDDGSPPSRQEIEAGAGDAVLSDGAAYNAAQRDPGNTGSGADKGDTLLWTFTVIISILQCRCLLCLIVICIIHHWLSISENQRFSGNHGHE